MSIDCETFGTGRYPAAELTRHIREIFDLRPSKIIEHLELRRPFYRKTAAYGHFGRDLPDFRWEALDKVEELKAPPPGPRFPCPPPRRNIFLSVLSLPAA